MPVGARKLTTEVEFLALPESVDKTELLDGEVVVSPSPSYWHQEVLQRFVFALRQWANAGGHEVTIGQAPLDVRFGPDRVLQPDAFVLRGRVSAEHAGPINQVPELCIEVLSTDRAYDRVTKRLLYGQAGVAEYWVVEPSGLVERWSGDGLAAREEITGVLISSLLPGLSIDLPELFER